MHGTITANFAEYDYKVLFLRAWRIILCDKIYGLLRIYNYRQCKNCKYYLAATCCMVMHTGINLIVCSVINTIINCNFIELTFPNPADTCVHKLQDLPVLGTHVGCLATHCNEGVSGH